MWQREGFPISARIDSLKRHYECVHARDYSEDHIAHLIWGFMAIAHVNRLFPGPRIPTIYVYALCFVFGSFLVCVVFFLFFFFFCCCGLLRLI